METKNVDDAVLCGIAIFFVQYEIGRMEYYPYSVWTYSLFVESFKYLTKFISQANYYPMFIYI